MRFDDEKFVRLLDSIKLTPHDLHDFNAHDSHFNPNNPKVVANIRKVTIARLTIPNIQQPGIK